MRFRYTIKELEEKSDYEMLRCIVVERESDTTNMHSPLSKRLQALKQKLANGELLTSQDDNSETVEEEDTNNHITILYHDISYYLDDGSEIEDGDCEYEHIVYSINQGYREGELNKMKKDGNDGNRGYWQIVRE